MLPPGKDRVDREGRGVLDDPDRDPALICDQVIDPVGDRVAQQLVFEVVASDLDRLAR